MTWDDVDMALRAMEPPIGWSIHGRVTRSPQTQACNRRMCRVYAAAATKHGSTAEELASAVGLWLDGNKEPLESILEGS